MARIIAHPGFNYPAKEVKIEEKQESEVKKVPSKPKKKTAKKK